MDRSTRGWIVTFAGLGINLALGVLYTWSVVAKALTLPAADGGKYLWTASQANWPYAFAVGTFALTMVFAGRLQDSIGPRWVATAGGIMVGAGMIVASLSPVTMASKAAFPTTMVLGFGILTGAGIGLAYASATPAAVKWFHPSKKGLIVGLVVAGFGLASIYTAPLTNTLIKSVGVNNTFMYLGIGFLIAIIALAQLLQNPPAGYVPPVPAGYVEKKTATGAAVAKREYTWQEMMRTPQFYLVWLMYAFAAFAGLMIVGIMAKIAGLQLGKSVAATLSYTLVIALAVGNGLGRPIAGIVSDRLGRNKTMLFVFVFQAILMVALNFAFTVPIMLVLAVFIGANYGANLTLFPAETYDFFGTKNGGVNYGLVFTAWGVGGVFGSQVAAAILDATKSYTGAYYLAAGLLLAAAAISFVVKAPKAVTSEDANPDMAPAAAR